jgi:hypothetical protein
MTQFLSKKALGLTFSAALLALPLATARADDTTPADRRIGYVLTDYHWAMYQTPDGKMECPNGYNDGPREQFKALFPDDGTKRKMLDTQIARENDIWFPSTSAEAFTFKEVQSKISFGLNLDGKVGEKDFVGPDGEKGIDNQMYRVMGCIANYRGPEGTLYVFTNKYLQQHLYNRVVIELTEVDSLVNDDSVILTTYRGRDKLMTDATGASFIAGGSQRIDMRWGKQFIHTFKAKIVDGVLTTEPGEWTFPATAAFEDTTFQRILGTQFKLKVMPDKAEGFAAGYTDIEAFYVQLNASWSTHHQSYGQQSSQSMYRAMRRLADGYPDANGVNTAISSALDVKFTQVFLHHPPQQTAASGSTVAKREAGQ